MTTTPAAVEARYHFLLGFLIERGVLTDRRYGNGTWSLQGIYGVDDSGLRGAGRTPEEALDNAIVAVNLSPDNAAKFWRDTHAALAHQPTANTPTHTPPTGVSAAVQAKREPQWQEISTAPKTDARIIGAVDGVARFICWGKTSHVPMYGWVLTDQGPEECDLCSPTYWMELPTPPIGAAGEGAEPDAATKEASQP